jgi:hypothetical protein
VAIVSCPADSTSSSPPTWTNVEIVSTSVVTRPTRPPRRSAFWLSIDRSCTCRKAATRKVANPASVDRKIRTVAR